MRSAGALAIEGLNIHRKSTAATMRTFQDSILTTEKLCRPTSKSKGHERHTDSYTLLAVNP
jgi:hypothetical protein